MGPSNLCDLGMKFYFINDKFILKFQILSLIGILIFGNSSIVSVFRLPTFHSECIDMESIKL